MTGAQTNAEDDETVGAATTSSQSTGAGISFLERLRAEHVKVNSYGEPTYWDERYENSRREHGQNHSFDFYVKPERIIELVELHIGKDRGARVLVLGCGNSKLSEAIADKGYKSVSYMRGGERGSAT